MFARIDGDRSDFIIKVTKGLLAVAAVGALVSFVTISCDENNFGLSITDHDADSCQVHSVAESTENKEHAVFAMMPNPLKKLFFLASIFLLIIASRYEAVRRLPPDIIQRRRFLFWLWARSRPFISNNTFIPYFSPIRDA